MLIRLSSKDSSNSLALILISLDLVRNRPLNYYSRNGRSLLKNFIHWSTINNKLGFYSFLDQIELRIVFNSATKSGTLERIYVCLCKTSERFSSRSRKLKALIENSCLILDLVCHYIGRIRLIVH